VVPLATVTAPVDVKAESAVAVRVVTVATAGVVAPTVPLMLIEAVPVKLVTVPLEGVPNAPPFTTGAPAVPTLTAKAVATPVPKPLTPVDIGRPVALVKTPLAGVPNAGVTNVGLVANTKAPVPVSSVTAAARLALEGVPKNVATPVPNDVMPVPPFATGSVPVTPVDRGKPVALVSVTDVGVPNKGVTSVGLVANTKEPDPVSSVTAVIKLAEEGVAKNVATPVPKPLMPVETGRPVALVSVAEEGVPNAGVTNVGLVAKTKEPVPVSSVTAAIKFEEEGVAKKVATSVPKPLMPVATGRPVALVKVPEEGVPNTPPLIIKEPAEPVLTASAVVTPVPKPLMPVATGKPVTLVRVPEEGVPNTPPLTIKEPAEPMFTASAEATPVANPLIPVETGSPVALVRVTEEGVPNAGVTSVGLVDITTLPVPVMALLIKFLVASVNTA